MQEYMKKIIQAAEEMGYDIDNPYFSQDMRPIWESYFVNDIKPRDAVALELGE